MRQQTSYKRIFKIIFKYLIRSFQWSFRQLTSANWNLAIQLSSYLSLMKVLIIMTNILAIDFNESLNYLDPNKSEHKMSRKFCTVENWRPPEQTWACDCENFPGPRFALYFECEKIFVGHYFALHF